MVDNANLIPHKDEYFVDRVHLSDLGAKHMAENLYPEVVKLLQSDNLPKLKRLRPAYEKVSQEKALLISNKMHFSCLNELSPLTYKTVASYSNPEVDSAKK